MLPPSSFQEGSQALPAQSTHMHCPSHKSTLSPGPLCPPPADPTTGTVASHICSFTTCFCVQTASWISDLCAHDLVGLYEPPGRVGVSTPHCSVQTLVLIHSISTQILSLGPWAPVSREHYFYPGILPTCQPCKQTELPTVSWRVPDPQAPVLWILSGILMALTSKHLSGQE